MLINNNKIKLLVGHYEKGAMKFIEADSYFKTWFIQPVRVSTYRLRHNNFSELLQASR